MVKAIEASLKENKGQSGGHSYHQSGGHSYHQSGGIWGKVVAHITTNKYRSPCQVVDITICKWSPSTRSKSEQPWKDGIQSEEDGSQPVGRKEASRWTLVVSPWENGVQAVLYIWLSA
jgi:hypothetical protein